MKRANKIPKEELTEEDKILELFCSRRDLIIDCLVLNNIPKGESVKIFMALIAIAYQTSGYSHQEFSDDMQTYCGFLKNGWDD